jgi:hypothetical protein
VDVKAMAESMPKLGRRDRLVFNGVLAAVVALPVAVAFVTTARSTGLPAGDNAIIEMSALDVPGTLPLIGMYSRFGFHHPGPLLFYAAAGAVRVFGPVGLAVAAASLSLLATVGLLVVLYRRGGQLLMFCGAVMVLLMIRALGIEVANIWNPWVPIVPLAAAVALTWSVWSRDWWALPWLAGAVSFIVQCHIGYAATGILLLGSSMGWAFLCAMRKGPPDTDGPIGRRLANPLTALVVSTTVLIVLWLPPLVDQLSRHPGNLSAIFDFVRSDQPQLGAGRGLGILSQVTGTTSPLVRGTGLGASLAPLEGSSAWGLVVVLAPFLAATCIAVLRRSWDAVRLAALVAVLVPVGWLSVAHITGLPYPYLADWLIVVAGYLWLSTVWSVASSFWTRAATFEFVPRQRPEQEPSRWAFAPLVIGGLVLAVLSGSAATAAARVPGGDTFAAGNVVARFAPAAENAVRGQDLVLVTSPPADANSGIWSLEVSAIESGIQAELTRRGLPVVTTNDRANLVGDHRTIGDRTATSELVITADTRPNPRVDSRVVSLATYDSLSPSERDEFQGLAIRQLRGPLSGTDLERWQELRARAVLFRLARTQP